MYILAFLYENIESSDKRRTKILSHPLRRSSGVCIWGVLWFESTNSIIRSPLVYTSNTSNAWQGQHFRHLRCERDCPAHLKHMEKLWVIAFLFQNVGRCTKLLWAGQKCYFLNRRRNTQTGNNCLHVCASSHFCTKTQRVRTNAIHLLAFWYRNAIFLIGGGIIRLGTVASTYVHHSISVRKHRELGQTQSTSLRFGTEMLFFQ